MNVLTNINQHNRPYSDNKTVSYAEMNHLT